MWLAAQSTRVQFARFLYGGAASITGDGNELFRGEFFAFHCKDNATACSLKMSNFAHFSNGQAPCTQHLCYFYEVSKNEHLRAAAL